MTTDRLAALLHEALCGPFGFHDDPATATCGALAARLAAAGVTVAAQPAEDEPVDECDHPWKPYCKDCQPAPDLRAAAQAVLDIVTEYVEWDDPVWVAQLDALRAALQPPRWPVRRG